MDTAQQFAPIAFAAVPPAVNNFEKAWHPIKRNAKKPFQKNKKGSDDRNNYDDNRDNYQRDSRDSYQDDYRDQMRSPEDRGLILKPRREVLSDEEIVELAPRNNELVKRPGGTMVRRASSWDEDHDYRRGRDYDRRERDYYDSESSMSPSRYRNGRGQGSSKRSSSSSSSSINSSTEDEKERRKMQRKKWLTTGLAGVATIHAASKIYSSLERRDKRTLELAKGTISPEEARKKRNEGRWQDAAAVGIAALGIKGAMGEWHEAREEQEEYQKHRQEQKERHEKRLRRIERARQLGCEPNIGHNHRSKSARP
ncbi:MAG: hypothetical protein Q9227_002600 [Pyrenula ochraceoflavens]